MSPHYGPAGEPSGARASVDPMVDREYGFKTRAIHAGNIPDATTGARALPIYQSSAFVFDDTADAAARFALQKYGNVYSRLSNPRSRRSRSASPASRAASARWPRRAG
ncbi:Methionine gamma-lyase [Clavibacter michiganensis subsp. michiganensis]|uniref:Methionine gamma-lyase n=1 Tax=Clavibacter michiganensis subsp. michiganensis TaxID=33013 RepID=A0A251XK36_CLAMM|nr:Methionine gamma-lyase [Clavibacter michiganensis subsp. michiganensis]OUE03720.1 Methionine gamma-lyase [Clavibacter michiganensis subsp. michiganensis]